TLRPRPGTTAADFGDQGCDGTACVPSAIEADSGTVDASPVDAGACLRPTMSAADTGAGSCRFADAAVGACRRHPDLRLGGSSKRKPSDPAGSHQRLAHSKKCRDLPMGAAWEPVLVVVERILRERRCVVCVGGR